MNSNLKDLKDTLDKLDAHMKAHPVVKDQDYVIVTVKNTGVAYEFQVDVLDKAKKASAGIISLRCGESGEITAF